MKKKVAIIGAGIAGLGAAVRMAARGHEVTVYEANSYTGGKLTNLELGAYRFDAGPSLFTMPQYIDELFTLAGESPSQHFSYDRIPTVCHYFWEDGTTLFAPADHEAFAKAVETTLNEPAAQTTQYLARNAHKYETTGRIFLEQSLHKAKTWWSKDVLKALFSIPKLDLFTTMNRVNTRTFKNPKTAQLFNRFATYNGSNPYRAPGMLTLIPHFEHLIGTYFPKGGMHEISQSVYALARRQGVDFQLNTPVEEIIVTNDQATGIRTATGTSDYDLVISNMDVYYTYRKLLPTQKAPEQTLKQERSTSALIFYWGIEDRFANLDLHNIFFSKDYNTEFDHLSAGTVSNDPTVYVHISSKYAPEDAPPNGENWFVMINVPPNTGQDWDAWIPELRQRILTKLERVLGRPVEALIREEAVLDPRSIDEKTGSFQGSLYGTSSNNRMAAFMRHPNFSKRIKNLYFCGGSVHPGGGIPLALLSAKIIDDLVHG